MTQRYRSPSRRTATAHVTSAGFATGTAAAASSAGVSCFASIALFFRLLTSRSSAHEPQPFVCLARVHCDLRLRGAHFDDMRLVQPLELRKALENEKHGPHVLVAVKDPGLSVLVLGRH